MPEVLEHGMIHFHRSGRKQMARTSNCCIPGKVYWLIAFSGKTKIQYN